uniref:Iodothyronine deiodinase n=1 Tax=Gopherus evgoodei TaxID=1825980 RepID=A0A8C4WIG0_9SAUR
MSRAAPVSILPAGLVGSTLILLYVSLCVAVGKILIILFPEMMKRYILKRFSYENWGPTFFSLKYLLFVLKVKWKRLEDEAFLGHNAPNTPVADFRGEVHHILDFIEKFGLYFVLYFDLCSTHS